MDNENVLTDEDFSAHNEEKEPLIKKVCFFSILVIIFVSTILQIYSILFTFFTDLNLPDLMFNKNVVIAFIILFDELEIVKCILIHKYSNLNFFAEFIYAITMCAMAIGMMTGLLYLVGLSALLMTGITVYQTVEEIDYNILFFVNLVMTILSSLFTMFLYILCVIN